MKRNSCKQERNKKAQKVHRKRTYGGRTVEGMRDLVKVSTQDTKETINRKGECAGSGIGFKTKRQTGGSGSVFVEEVRKCQEGNRKDEVRPGRAMGKREKKKTTKRPGTIRARKTSSWAGGPSPETGRVQQRRRRCSRGVKGKKRPRGRWRCKRAAPAGNLESQIGEGREELGKSGKGEVGDHHRPKEIRPTRYWSFGLG